MNMHEAQLQAIWKKIEYVRSHDPWRAKYLKKLYRRLEKKEKVLEKLYIEITKDYQMRVQSERTRQIKLDYAI